MKKLMLLAVLLLGLGLLVGCGDGDDTAAETTEAATDVADDVIEAAQDAADAAGTAMAMHDCAGGCGMKDVPEATMVEKDGEWYCAGCATKMEADDHGDHEGHDHG